ncbi:energy transducer TonB [Rhodobacteraceae bacterium CH30]|nr:energy transducer TonB [Rhodobacteraceae bacterium CH30]
MSAVPHFTPAVRIGSATFIKVALLLSLALHLILLAWPSVSLQPLTGSSASMSELKVSLLHRPTLEKPPETTRELAQADSLGGGTAVPESRVMSPAEPRPAVSGSGIAPEGRAQTTVRHERLTRDHSSYAIAGKGESLPSADSLLAQARELAAQQQGEIGTRTSFDDAAPKRGVFGVSARGVEWARYAEDWRLKIERIGKLNYPDEARRQGLFGSLVLKAVLGSDGRLLSVSILRSSGQPVLDEAALHIVRMASPFAPFPPGLAAKFGSLEIARKWSFSSDNELSTR